MCEENLVFRFGNSAHVNRIQNCSKAGNVFMTIAVPIQNIQFDTDYIKWLLARQQADESADTMVPALEANVC